MSLYRKNRRTRAPMNCNTDQRSGKLIGNHEGALHTTLYEQCRDGIAQRCTASVWAILLLAVVFQPVQGGVLVAFPSSAPNNDDFSGPFQNNVNRSDGINLTGFTRDHIFVVAPSGGTTEYAFDRGGNFTIEPTDSISLELGFGIGDNFASAADFIGLPGLDFDTPLPNAPAPASSVFATVDHQPHRITFTNGFADRISPGVAQFSLDVPDLDTSLNDQYRPGELPGNLPAGAAAFTLRMRGGARIVPSLAPEFENDYTIVDLGEVESAFNCCGPYAGLTFKPDDPQTLLFGINAWSRDGALYEVEVLRDADNHVTGFAGPARRYLDTPYIGGGVQFGPDGVLFWSGLQSQGSDLPPGEPAPDLGQSLPGSTKADKLVFLEPLGVTGEVLDALTFVPAGMPGEGQLKVVGGEGQWYTLDIAADDRGTFDVTRVRPGPRLRDSGATGIAYVPRGSPIFGQTSTVLYSRLGIVAYDVDANGDPILGTEREFLQEFGEEFYGAAIDPLTGDLLFAMTPFFGDGKFFAVRGFAAPVPESTTASLGLVALALLALSSRAPQAVSHSKK